jgi:Protein of unknown function (DUF1559)
VYGEDGRPLYGWRVLILPYIEQDRLYGQFRLDEPWDSPHNVRLLEQMPRIYGPPSAKEDLIPRYHSVCHVFTGESTAFEGREGLKFADDFPDGTSNTLMFVEAGAPVPWSKPREIYYDPDWRLPELRGLFHDIFRSCLADGSRRYIRKTISPATLRAAITRNGGETLGSDW